MFARDDALLLTFKAVQHPTCLALVHLHDSNLRCVYPMIFVMLPCCCKLSLFPAEASAQALRIVKLCLLTWTTSTTRVHAGSRRQSTYVCSRPQSNLAG